MIAAVTVQGNSGIMPPDSFKTNKRYNFHLRYYHFRLLMFYHNAEMFEYLNRGDCMQLNNSEIITNFQNRKRS